MEHYFGISENFAIFHLTYRQFFGLKNQYIPEYSGQIGVFRWRVMWMVKWVKGDIWWGYKGGFKWGERRV